MGRYASNSLLLKPDISLQEEQHMLACAVSLLLGTQAWGGQGLGSITSPDNSFLHVSVLLGALSQTPLMPSYLVLAEGNIAEIQGFMYHTMRRLFAVSVKAQASILCRPTFN